MLSCTEYCAVVKTSPFSLTSPKEDGEEGWADAQGAVGLLESEEKHRRDLLVISGPWSPAVTSQVFSAFRTRKQQSH